MKNKQEIATKASYKSKADKNNKSKQTTANSYTQNRDSTKVKQQASTNQESRTKQNVQLSKNNYSNQKASLNAIGKATVGTKQKNHKSSNKNVKADQTIRILTNYGAQSANAANRQNTYTKNNYRSSQGSKIEKSDAKSESVMVQNGARTDTASLAVSRDRAIDANQDAAISTVSNGMTEIVLNQQMAAQSRRSRTETSSSSVANSESGSSSSTATAAGALRTDGLNQVGSYGTVARSSHQYESSSKAESKKSETYEESSRVEAASQVKAQALYAN